MFFIWKIEYILFLAPNCKGWSFIFAQSLLFWLVTVAGVSSLLSNDFSVLRKTDDLLDVRGHLKHFQLSVFNSCSFFDLLFFPVPFSSVSVTHLACISPSHPLSSLFFFSGHHLFLVFSGSFLLLLYIYWESSRVIYCCWITFPTVVLCGFPVGNIYIYPWLCIYILRTK